MSSDSSHTGDKEMADRSEGEKAPAGIPAADQLPTLINDNETQITHDVKQIPWRYKIAAGSMIILFAFGSSLSESTFGPLKSTLVEELGITSESADTEADVRSVEEGTLTCQTLSMALSLVLPA